MGRKKADAKDQTLSLPSGKPERLAAVALTCLYAAIMSGHLASSDGLLMYRQATAIVYRHTLHFEIPIGMGTEYTTSKYGIGLSLLYVPGLVLFSWLQPHMPVPAGQVLNYWRLLYADPLYAVVCGPVQVVIASASAYLVARLIRALGLGTSAALWGLALYGLASPAIVYARDDWSQPLAGLCWIAAVYTALLFQRSGATRTLVACGLATCYAVLTRPIEGTLLLSALAVLIVPGSRISIWPTHVWKLLVTVATSYSLGIAITLLINWGRYGSPLTFGYVNEGWTTPLLTGLAGTIISPGRGIVWEFPAVLLVPLGLRLLWPTRHRRVGVALVGLILLQLVNVATWDVWWGGWNWGLRLFVPALPLIAVLAAVGIAALPRRSQLWIPALLFVAGVIWSLPGVLTDFVAGYARMTDGSAASFALSAYPPIGAWQYLNHPWATNTLDFSAVDIVWFRVAQMTHYLSLLPLLILLGLAAAPLYGLVSMEWT